MKKFIPKTLCFLSIIFLLTSCIVGPDYIRPSTTVPAKFKEAKGTAFTVPPKKNWKLAKPCDDVERGEWWKIFHDPQLDALEQQLNIFNQSINNALANYIQARAVVDEARASYNPTVSGILSFAKNKGGGTSSVINTSSSTGTTSASAQTSGGTAGGSASKVTATTYSASLIANWEPDFWGLVHRTVEADVALAQSDQALLAVTRLSAQGSLAQYYFKLRALDMDQLLLDKTVASYKKSLELTQNQYASGVASRADIVQAQSQLELAEAQAINNGVLRGQYEHAIAALMGRPPADFTLPFAPLKAKPPVIPVSIPTEWLERRPDIAQAERLIQQTNAQIGISIAAYYPSINLSGSGSVVGGIFGSVINSPTIGWSYALQAAEIIFDGGLRRATVSAAKAGYAAQVAAYRQTVLTAFQDVEDNLVALRLLEKEGVVQNKAAASAELALKLVINQYKAGTVDYASVVTSQIAAYTAQKNAYDIVGQQMTAAVGLVKALGGGWSVADIAPA
jgi:NodT family efflux transporter outer membrane factor (OMF) lipoprotein